MFEIRTATIQAALFTSLAGDMSFESAAGPSAKIRFPVHGPHDRRLGYVDLPRFVDALTRSGFEVERQARISESLDRYMAHGGYAPYETKSRTGLTLLDRKGDSLFAARQPLHIYPDFSAVPPLVVDTLLYIENRELFETAAPKANPAIEWDRFALSTARLSLRSILRGGERAGGSTLATQMEKFMHSPGGRTGNASEKLRQMLAASLRAYRHGPYTMAARRHIVVRYLNSTPLAAVQGGGEVIGLGDGVAAWYGSDFEEVNRLLRTPAGKGSALRLRARAYRQVLSLLIAQRRPSELLIRHPESLNRLVDSYLRLLVRDRIIARALGDAALAERSSVGAARDSISSSAPAGMAGKSATTLRGGLMSKLGMRTLYDLDRLDLTVETTVDKAVQGSVTDALRRLSDHKDLETLGLTGKRLVDRGAPERIIYSLTLYERGSDRNFLRVQSDNDPRSLDVNEGTRLDLGSTAKLRTLISYLEVVSALYHEQRARSRADLRRRAAGGDDRLTRWVARRLLQTGDIGLEALLADAMQRQYSASPDERFFTAGGVHRFANFDAGDNDRTLSVAEGFRRSVNLVFIRVMRDVVDYHIARILAHRGDLYAADNPHRTEYLREFAQREGAVYLTRFHALLAEPDRGAILSRLAARVRPHPTRLAVIFRSLHPEADEAALAEFFQRRLPGERLSGAAVARLFEKYGRDRFSLNDRAYLAHIHPLELWLAEFLVTRPHASLHDAMAASAEVRTEAYRWLFRPGRKRAQDLRIRILLEEEAFQRIGAGWRRLGYPFERLIPSYASSIGSSGDRPSALAELMGIIANDGVRRRTVGMERLRFAEGTPFETVMRVAAPPAERVLERELVRVVRRALIETVETGTGKRVSGAFRAEDGSPLVVGGKTGTGDHRYETFARDGTVVHSRVVNRSAAFVFFLGDRFYGTVMAYVAGPAAANYDFTSALPTQLLKSLAPQLQPLVAQVPATSERPPKPGRPASGTVQAANILHALRIQRPETGAILGPALPR